MRKKLGIILTVFLLLLSTTSTLFASGVSDTKAPEQNQEEQVKSLYEPINPTAAGETIANTFPDPNFAQAIADVVSGGNVNAILTQTMVEDLTDLQVPDKGIQDITGIEVLSSLIGLNVSGNQLTSLPESIGTLSSLKILFVYNNKLTSLPESIGDLHSLRTLYAYHNELTSLPASIGDLSGLSILLVHNNELTGLPVSICNLSSLKGLDVSANELTSLPENIGNLSSLTWLSVDNTELISLPESFGNLSSLQTLYASGNELTSLPESFGNLSSLQTLDLSSNLLPTAYEGTLNTLGLNFTVVYDQQNQLRLKSGLSPYTIKSESDLDNINLFDIVEFFGGDAVSTAHNFILDNYVDEDGAPVDLSDYIENGIVIKEGKVFAQERITGTGIGLFPNDSDHALTVGKIQLNFEMTYYDLLFELNGGAGTGPDAQALLEGEVGTAVSGPVREGFSFKGWNTAQDGRGTNWIPGTTPMLATGVTLYAQWEENPKTYYDLLFELNGGAGTCPDAQALLEGEVGAAVNNPVREGFSFKGWNTAQDGRGTNWIPGTTPMAASGVTLYAQWEENVVPILSVPLNIITLAKLPKTGNNGVILLGMVLLSLGGLLVVKKFKKTI